MRTGAGCKRLAVFASFEFDLETRELKKDGLPWRLEDKPALLLACLLERQGEVVDRSHLIHELWPGESHGQFDHRLNKAINKLRSVIGDDSSNPRFIQTLKRRGYRFIADVQFVDAAGSANELSEFDADEHAERAVIGSDGETPLTPASASIAHDRSSNWRWLRLPSQVEMVVAIAFITCLLIGLVLAIGTTHSHAATHGPLRLSGMSSNQGSVFGSSVRVGNENFSWFK